MDYTGFNMSRIKNANRASVLYLLNGRKSMSRKDIADSLGLTPAAVSKICAELIAEGAVSECGFSDGAGAGRRKIILSLNSSRFAVLAVSIDAGGYYCGICTLGGEETVGEYTTLPRDTKPEDFLRAVGESCRRLIKNNPTGGAELIGAGVGIVGGADSLSGKTTGSYGVWRPGINIKKILEYETGLPVCVDNNVKAFALASLIFDREHSADNILFVKWGPGVGSAIVINGEVLNGTDSGSSEIGHYIVDPNGEKCRCGRRGCLETEVSAPAVINCIRAVYSEKATPTLFKMTDGDADRIDIRLILSAAKSDGAVKSELERCADSLAKAVTNAATVIAPDSVVAFGYMFESDIFELFAKRCAKYYPGFGKGYIRLSPLDGKHSFIGPAALAAKKFFFEK